MINNTEQQTLANYLGNAVKAQALEQSVSDLMFNLATICAQIAKVTARGALSGVTGKLNRQNVQGETQMEMDVLTNELFIDDLAKNPLVAGLASEEEGVLIFENARDAKYLVVFDPLDGSSNVPVNVSVGSIFSVLNAPQGRPTVATDFLQAGNKQVAAGYALYGPSTMFVFTVGNGTHGFTLDPEIDTFVLTHPNMQVADKTSEFAINASNERFWDAPTVRYVEECKAGVEGKRGRNFNMRWVASMVADVHRILLRGGIYLYPKDNKKPPREGRLRLMYEANPAGMLIEQAGGRCSTGTKSILEVEPEEVHQRIPVIIGTSEEVNLIERYTSTYASGNVQIGDSPLFANKSLFH